MTIHAALLCLALSAPVPLPKAPPPPPRVTSEALLGEWDCRWGSTPCVMIFRKGGVYGCTWMGQDWYGSWELKDGVLTIAEQPYGQDLRLEWAIRLSGPYHGNGLTDTPTRTFPFSLHPRGSLIKGPAL